MNNEKVEETIWKEIIRREIDFNDLVRNFGKFSCCTGSERMKELLQIDSKNYSDYPPLKIPFKNLFRFWFEKIVDKDDVVDMVLDDIYDYILEQMRPEQKEPKNMLTTINYNDLERM